jgi:hypothetical protein
MAVIFLINKTLVELFALFVIYAFPTAHIIGIERFWATVNKMKA